MDVHALSELSNHADVGAARFDLPVYCVHANTNVTAVLLTYTARLSFLRRAAKLPLQALDMLRHIHLSVRPSVRYTPVLCQYERTQRDAVFTVG